jgi:hypothetical protein
MRGLKPPKIKLAKVRKQTARTVNGWRIEREEIKDKNRVSITILRPDGYLRFKLVMTTAEWKEFKK